MKTKTTKFMTLMTVSALGIFSAGTVMVAGNNDFYTQPPAGSAWEKADTEGTYASYTNGSDYVNIYKYSLEDVKTGIAKCNDTYEACYQTIYSEGNSLYMAVGYAKDAGDIGDVRKFVEYISYPGNPSLTREADENAAGNSDKSETGTSAKTACCFRHRRRFTVFRSAQSVFCQKVNCPAAGKRSPSGGRTCRGRKRI